MILSKRMIWSICILERSVQLCVMNGLKVSEIMQEEKAGHVFGGYVRGVQAKDSCERKGGAGFEKH